MNNLKTATDQQKTAILTLCLQPLAKILHVSFPLKRFHGALTRLEGAATSPVTYSGEVSEHLVTSQRAVFQQLLVKNALFFFFFLRKVKPAKEAKN